MRIRFLSYMLLKLIKQSHHHLFWYRLLLIVVLQSLHH